MSFKALTQAKAQPALRTVTLPPSAFAETWSRRPRVVTKVGLRSVSEAELDLAQKAAAQAAWSLHPQDADQDLRVAAYNDHLITNVLARACCKADDVAIAFFAPAPEDLIREGLTPAGVRRLWEAYCQMAIADGPLSPEATDAEAETLGIATKLVALSDWKATRARRLAKALLEELG